MQGSGLSANQKGKEAETAQGLFKTYMDKYKDKVTAKLAAKNTALEALKLDLQRMELKTNSALAKENIRKGYAELELNQQKVQADLYQKLIEQQKKEQKGVIPGYQGTIEDPTAAREFRTQEVDAAQATNDLKKLLQINNAGLVEKTLSPAIKADVDAARIRLQGSLRVALLGPGTVNDSERKLLENAVADPTSFFSLASSNEIKLKSLMRALNNKVEANARSYGLTKIQPTGLKK